MPKIKQIPEDFVVREVFEKQPVRKGHRTEDSDYVWFTLKKTDYNLFRAIKTISRRLGVSFKRFGYAGTKDKRAVTYQRVSVWKVPVERLENLRLRDIELSDFEEKRERINLGDLKGNEFRITVRDIGLEGKELEKEIRKRIRKIGKEGLINFFGSQRFGSKRKVSHIVGRSIVENNPRQAVIDYLTVTSEDEPEGTRRFREGLSEGFDPKRGLEECPGSLRFEKAMLNHLVSRENDYAGALRKLPKSLRRLFVHAYQAYLWNETAKVSKEETIPLIGYGTELEKYGDSRGLSRVMKKEKIKTGDFKIRSMPELSSEGSERERVVFPEGLIFSVGEDELNKGRRKLVIEFFIPKGSYATVVVDRLMKGIK